MKLPPKKSGKKLGLAPGTVVYIGEKKIEQPRIRFFEFDQEHCDEEEVSSIEECFHLKDTTGTAWINIDGLHDTDLIEKIGKHYNLHPLVLEDIASTKQRAKVEDYGDYIYSVLRMMSYDEDKNEVISEQLSLILGPRYVLTFQERVGDYFEPVRNRIRKTKWRDKKLGADYLAYVLMDTLVDHYFVILERISEKIEFLDEVVINDPTPKTLKEIKQLKNNIIILKKSLWPLRELVSQLMKTGSQLITEMTELYLRDLYDHAVQVTEGLETLRDTVSGLMDIYLSSVSNRMNEIMKVLTIFAAIFIPLTFMAGIYGMNFEFMPELKWHYAYPVLLVAMVTVVVGMLYYFRGKHWI